MPLKRVELEDGVEVQWVCIYVLRWKPEWGKPDFGLIEVDEDEEDNENN